MPDRHYRGWCVGGDLPALGIFIAATGIQPQQSEEFKGLVAVASTSKGLASFIEQAVKPELVSDAVKQIGMDLHLDHPLTPRIPG